MIDSLLKTLGVILTRDIKARIRANQVTPASKSGGTTLVRSAKLVNSIAFTTTQDSVIVGTNLRYARIHHEGGIIRPVNARYLAIPLTKEAAVKRPRDFQSTFIKKGVIFQKTADGSITPIYALKKQVTIPARPYMFITPQTRATLESAITTWFNHRKESL